MLVILFLLFLFYFYRGVQTLDPDFGWHIRMGQIILNSGIPKTDQLSYTMSHYPLIDHEWLTNVLMSILYPRIGMLGLSAIFAFITVLAVYVASRMVLRERMRWAAVPVFLTGTTLLSFAAVRTQVISWLMLAVFLQLMFNPKLSRCQILLPVLFIIWVNLHGSFALGIVLLGVIIAVKFLQGSIQYKKPFGLRDGFKKRRPLFVKALLLIKKIGNSFIKIRLNLSYGIKQNKKLISIFAFSTLATFINPYGIRIWYEVWMQISDQQLRKVIGEWTPGYDMPNLMYWAFFALAIMLVVRYRKKFDFGQLAVFIVLLAAGLSSKRHIPLWLINALPMVITSIYYLSEDAAKIIYGKKRFNLAYKAFFVLCIILFMINGYIMYFSFLAGSEAVYYPAKAAEYINSHRSTGNVWSVYDWNSYLLWKAPGVKVFVHGMMPSWRYHKYPGESEYVLAEHNRILVGEESFAEVMQKYNIDTVLLPSELMQDSFFSERTYSISPLSKQIAQMRLKEVYRDEKAVIFKLD